jgi:hypothetical protein
MIKPRISFGIIVFNGDPFIRYNLRALYPFAHQILVVEGACIAAKNIATSDGHSTDNTLEILHQFKRDEDAENKLEIITRDGFWSEKDEQSQAYAEKATGDFLWQVDIDEFYKPEDMATIINMISEDPSISGASIKQLAFWGGFDYLTDGFYLRGGASHFRRLFRWGPAFTYVTHRPPTVLDSSSRDLCSLNWIDAEKLTAKGLFIYHYAFVFPKQVLEKSEYYGQADWSPQPLAKEWAKQSYMNLRKPYRIHNEYNSLSWLERFHGEHPPQIRALISDIQNGKVKVDLRQTSDIEKLLRSPSYKIGRSVLMNAEHFYRKYQSGWNRQIYRAKHPVTSFRNLIRKSIYKV